MIANVLMVTIIIFLAGVLAFYFFKIQSNSPQGLKTIIIDVKLHTENQTIIVNHISGEPIKWGDYRLYIEGVNVNVTGGGTQTVGESRTFISPINLSIGQSYSIKLSYLPQQQLVFSTEVLAGK